ncbi:MAG: hypothetical protein ACYS19_13760 [Planctomycetota bacterium]|jgi:hypothetical protein
MAANEKVKVRKKIHSKTCIRKIIFVILLLIACPSVSFVLRSNNLEDILFWKAMFIPGIVVTLVYLIISLGLWIFLNRKRRAYLILDIIVFTILLIALFSPFPNLSCQFSVSNGEINKEIRDELHALNDSIIESIRNNEPSVMYNLFVDEIRKKGIENINNLYSQISLAIEGKTFKQFNEYYAVSHNWWPVQYVVLSGNAVNSEFYMHVQTASNNVYISLLKSEDGFQDLLFGFVYVKLNRKWRLHIAHLGTFKLGDKNALGWYQEAVKWSREGYDIPAMIRLAIMNKLIKPAPFIQFAKEKEMLALLKETQTKISQRYKFPIQLSSVKNAPEIYYIEPQFAQMDLLPKIKYVTNIPLDKVAELQEEVDSITVELESIFSGITQEVSHIVYEAFSEPPTDRKKVYQCYRLTSEVN